MENSLSIENCGCFSWQSVDCHKTKHNKKKGEKFVEFSQIRLGELARDLVGIFLELIKTTSARPLTHVRTVLDCYYVRYCIILDLFYYLCDILFCVRCSGLLYNLLGYSA